jgi:hypothetical protein
MISVKNEFLTCVKLRRAVELGGLEVYPTWLAMKAHCDAKGDGFIADETFDKLPGLLPNARKALRALVDCGEVSRSVSPGTSPGDSVGGHGGGHRRGHGLVDVVDGGFELHNYDLHGASPAAIEARRQREREKKARQRAKAKMAKLENVPHVSPGDMGGDIVGDNPGDSPGDVPVDMEKRRDKVSSSLSDPHSGSIVADPDPDPPVRSGSRARKARTVKRQLPDDWAPSEAHRAEAKALGVDCDLEAQKFRDYCLAHGKRYADTEAAFRNWLRNDWSRPKRCASGGSRTATDIAFERVRQLEDLELTERDKRDLDEVFP